MDPLSALSLAATLVQLVDFTSKIVSKGYHIYNDTDQALPQNVALEYLVTDLQNLNARLHHHDRLSCATRDEQALEDLSASCAVLADELVSRLNKLKVADDAKHRKWKSFRQALKSVWSKEELDAMAAKLFEYRNQLEFHVLLSLKEKIDLLEIQLSNHFDRLDEATKCIIRMLEQNETPFTNEFKAQNTIIAKLHHDNRLHVSKEHEKTRVEIIQAINAHRVSKGESDRVVPILGATSDARKHAVVISILDSLKFPSMCDRYDGIDDAHKRTFDWIFRHESNVHSWSNFSDWLVQGAGIYWINGKPGSGKSTLMRYIYEDARTLSLLGQWAGSPDNLTVAAFFFWKSGTADQASQTGLLRSLLYTILSKHKTHIPAVFPDEWRTFYDRKSAQSEFTMLGLFEHRWTLKQLKAGFQRFFQIDLGRVCLFIDGLDEYDGDHTDTISLLKAVASTNIKICLSSRPWVEFQEAFESQPSLRLQDLTFDDIALYVNEKLTENERTFFDQEPLKISYFVSEIVTKADGVFLWVKLVVRSLLDGLNNGDSIAEFDRRLHELPSDLESLYTQVFNNISSRYLAEGSQIFQIMRATNNWKPKATHSASEIRLCALTLSFAIEDTEERAINTPAMLISDDEIVKRVERIDKRLKVCCAGLLELSSKPSLCRNEPREDGNTTTVLERSRKLSVKYLHRTAKDFLDNDQILANIQRATTGTNFSVYSSLLKSSLLWLKICRSPSQRIRYFRPRLELPMEIAYAAQEESNTSNVELLDELGASISRLRPVKADFLDPKYSIMTYERFDESWPDNFLFLASRFSLSTYLAVKLVMPNTKTGREGAHSYLFHALHRQFFVPPDFTGILSEHTVDLLLQYSSRADIKEGWICALNYIVNAHTSLLRHGDAALMLIKIFKLFLDYGADPGLRVMGNERSDGPREYSVSDVLDRISAYHPEAAAEVYRMVNRRSRFLYRAGLSRRTKTPDPRKWHSRYH
ncbi:hypothetical protein EG329_011664 [Mollisiaceae sp. DMI_Dod_QoI]|nr:hypothetical protein EG329_011664 [Helotiales sp. DMI_Dod_QoI]